MMAIDLSPVQVLVLDVLGTVVDERGSVAAESRAALAAAGESPERGDELAAAWLSRLDELMGDITAGRAEWRTLDELNRAALTDVATDLKVELGEPALDELAMVAHRLRPWPDAKPGLRALADRFVVAALSNANVSALAGLSHRGGLRWHCALSAEMVRAYKPEPAVYRHALELLGVEPNEALMVAVHPWDLRAAAAQGMRTALISRTGEDDPEPSDEFDVEASDLAKLAATLL